MKGEKIRERDRSSFRYGQNVVFVEAGNNANGSGHQTVGVFDHHIPFCQFPFGKIDGMATITRLGHLLPFLLPIFLSEPCHIRRFDHIQAGPLVSLQGQGPPGPGE